MCAFVNRKNKRRYRFTKDGEKNLIRVRTQRQVNPPARNRVAAGARYLRVRVVPQAPPQAYPYFTTV